MACQAQITLLAFSPRSLATVFYILPALVQVYEYAQSVVDRDQIETPATCLIPLTFELHVPESLQLLERTQVPASKALYLVQSVLC